MLYYPHEKLKRQERQWRRRAPGRPEVVRARGQGKPLVRAHEMREEGLRGLHGRHGAAATGAQFIGGKWYFFWPDKDPNECMLCVADESGAMVPWNVPE